MRLDKFLANSGIGTRKEVKEIIKNRKIFVNDKIVMSSDLKIDETKDIIKYENNVINYTKFRYIMLNKPKGYISATNDNKQKTVLDLITDFKTYKLFPVGRLDIDTEGLLLLTNDGDLAHNLLSPKKHVEKKYYVELSQDISSDDISNIEKGIDIGEGIITRLSKIIKVDDNKLYIIITEGKFHQVKRMFKAVNNEVKYLKRISMGSLILDEKLNLGEYRELTYEELRSLL
ncbi:pseudouridine synthase [Streptobacillus moniliformis]|uniref:Pseudouridine synthase n=1 Tax=Streptobacillus moniliformis (strain ATCC 14647 / DSM 12112 / NCTC 10651 / 9901) TaxID=519441 RepID=D1AY40_STRM9|nr:pseudouridine synthase [Streptobacillus moniliformis]ACZ01216.1 pseudouridine synthase [Streptobacillus moniliformis DSM 12112]AVL42425.1 rRNA pseudouridine synthase [Streptobacillus moniliformis]SQA13630.1 Ribosomal small subunit pseudouridine synthase A [Streptobacillus moniliformis]